MRCRACASAFPRACYAVKAFTAHAVAAASRSTRASTCSRRPGGEVRPACGRARPPPAIVLHGNDKSDEELELARRRRRRARDRRRPRRAATARRVAASAAACSRSCCGSCPRSRSRRTRRSRPATTRRSSARRSRRPRRRARRPLTWPGVRFDGAARARRLAGARRGAVPAGRSTRCSSSRRGCATRPGSTSGVIDIGGGFGVRYVDEIRRRRWTRSRRPCSRDSPSGALRAGAARAAGTRRGAGAVARRQRRRHPLSRGGRARRSPAAAALLAVDGGMSDNLRPMLYDAAYTVALASAATTGDRPRPFTVVGRHCESGDILAEDVRRCRRTPGRATCSRSPPPARTRTRSRAPTTGSGARPSWPSRDGVRDARGSVARTPPTSTASRAATGPRAARPRRPTASRSAPRARATRAPSWRSGRRSSPRAGYVRTERVTRTPARYRRGSARPWTDREAQIVAVDDDDRVVGHVYIQRERASGHPPRRDARHRGRGRRARAGHRHARCSPRRSRWAASGRGSRRSCCRSTRTTRPRSPCTGGSASSRKGGSRGSRASPTVTRTRY